MPGLTNALESAIRINEALRETGGGLTLDGYVAGSRFQSHTNSTDYSSFSRTADSFSNAMFIQKLVTEGSGRDAIASFRHGGTYPGSGTPALNVSNYGIEAYYNGIKKLETTSAGAKVTGDAVITGNISATGFSAGANIGVSGSFTADGKTITVTSGIITGIV